MKNKTFLVVMVFTWMACSLFGKVTEAHNTLKEIDACSGKVKLILLRTWGGDEEEDLHKFFKDPMDIAFDKNGLIYICIDGLHCIRVFDDAGNYKRTIGKKGQGPTDFLNPSSLAFDIHGNLIVADKFNYRIQVLTPEGKYITGFKFKDGWISDIYTPTRKDEIVIHSFIKTFSSRKLLFIYDKKGKLLREIGDYVDNAKELRKSESVLFTMDHDDNIYAAYYGTPFIQKFSYNGDMLMFITYQLPFESRAASLDKNKQTIVCNGEKMSSVASALTCDPEGRIYLVTPKRLMTEKEKKEGEIYGVRSGGGGNYRKLTPVSIKNTDLYQLIVFNPAGKVIAAVQLNVFCHKISVHKDRLYIIDTIRTMKIYEYKINFK